MKDDVLSKTSKEWLDDWTELFRDHHKSNTDLVLAPEGCAKIAEYLLELQLYRGTNEN